MLKLYEVWRNSGGWNGDYSEYIVAESVEDAKSKVEQREGYNHYVWEVTGENLVKKLLLDKKVTDNYDININISITKKGA